LSVWEVYNNIIANNDVVLIVYKLNRRVTCSFIERSAKLSYDDIQQYTVVQDLVVKCIHNVMHLVCYVFVSQTLLVVCLTTTGAQITEFNIAACRGDTWKGSAFTVRFFKHLQPYK
jgi:hypothetical protein